MAVATPDGYVVQKVPFYKKRNFEATLAFILLAGPMMLGLLIFTYLPIGWGFLISLSEARNSVSLSEFIGFKNYADILKDSSFRASLRTILIFTAFIVPLTFGFSLLLAVLVNGVGFGKPFFRTIFFIPTAISYVVASLIWRMSLFNGIPSGVANIAAYEFFGHNPIQWIASADPPYYWVVLVTVRLWLQVGFYMIIFIAGLQEIPRDLYEAAYIDGAKGGWETFKSITFPMLRNASIAVLLLNFIAAFQAFDEFFNIMGGTAASAGNRALGRTPLIYLYQVAFTDQNYGKGAAGAFILTAIIVAITLVQGKVFGFGKKA